MLVQSRFKSASSATCWPTNVAPGAHGGWSPRMHLLSAPSSLPTLDLRSPLVPGSHVSAGINPWTTGVIIPNRMGLLNTGTDSAQAPVCFDQGGNSCCSCWSTNWAWTCFQRVWSTKQRPVVPQRGEDAVRWTDSNVLWRQKRWKPSSTESVEFLGRVLFHDLSEL